MPMRRSFNFWLCRVAVPLLVIYCLLEARGAGDLYIYLCAAGDLDGLTDIFVRKYIDEDYHYYYSVLFAWLLKPFYSISFYWVKFSWLLLNGLLFLHMLSLLYRSSMLSAINEKRKLTFTAIVFLASLRFVHENLHASQITILILWFTVIGLKNIFEDRWLRGALLLAAGINIKLLPLVFLPYLLYRARYKALAATIFFYVIFLFLPSLFVGHEYNMKLLTSWLSLINPDQSRHVLDVDERSFHGLSTLLSVLLVKDVPDYYALPLRRHILDIPIEQLKAVLLATRVLLVSAALFFLRWPPFRAAASRDQLCSECAYILMVIPLIFPHQQHYAFLFMIPAFAWVLQLRLRHIIRGRIYIWLLTTVYLLSNLKLLLGLFNAYYEHYKVLTYAALILLVTMVLAESARRRQTLTI